MDAPDDLLRITGGARIGWGNASAPLATLEVEPGEIRLKVKLFGDYRFAASEVERVAKHRGLFSRGIRIFHSRGAYPKKIVFWTFENTDALLAKIEALGFPVRR